VAEIPIDTNVILRYLVETPEECDARFRGVFSFFEKIETGQLLVVVPELVLSEAYFVLTSFYAVPRREAAEKLRRLVQFRGVRMT
jgi:predicted nucleic acid-binding protein